MFSVLVSAFLTICWTAIGAHELSQPNISHVAYFCTWGTLIVLYLLQTFEYALMYKKEHKNPV